MMPHIFCNGAVSKVSKKLRVGCIAFNNEEEILAKVAKIKDEISSLVAKVSAMEEVVDVALRYGWRNVCFNGDSKIVIDVIKNFHGDNA